MNNQKFEIVLEAVELMDLDQLAMLEIAISRARTAILSYPPADESTGPNILHDIVRGLPRP